MRFLRMLQVVSSIRHSQRQAFEVRPPKIRPGQSPSRAQTSTRATPTRTNLAQPHINADSATSSTLQASPSTALYSESVSCRTPTTLVPNNWDLSVAQEDSPMQLRIPQHLVLPLTIPDASYLSRIYTHYLQGAKQMLRSGVPRAHVLGADDEVAVDLFFRSRTDSDKFDCASWACEVFRSYDTDIFARMGSSYMLTLMMRVSEKCTVGWAIGD